MNCTLLGVVLGAVLGFTSAGIAAGSIASSMMSAAAAVANCGSVPAGSAVAFLQSIGALSDTSVDRKNSAIDSCYTGTGSNVIYCPGADVGETACFYGL